GLLRGVILVASFVRRPTRVPRWARHLARPWLFRLVAAAPPTRALLGRDATPTLRRLLAEAHARAGAAALARRAAAGLEVDATAALAACPVPILYVRSSDDAVIAASRADEIARLRPGVDVVDIAGPHMALVTDPRAAWSALQGFVERIERAHNS